MATDYTNLIAKLRWLLESPATDDRWTWYSGEYVKLAADALEAQVREIERWEELSETTLELRADLAEAERKLAEYAANEAAWEQAMRSIRAMKEGK